MEETKRYRITTGGGQKLTFVSYEKAKEYWDSISKFYSWHDLKTLEEVTDGV